MKKYLLKTYRLLLKLIEEVIPALSILLIIGVLIIQVFMRTVFRISYTELYELSIWGYIWLLYLGAAYAARLEEHVKLDILYEKFSFRGQKIIDTIFNLFVVGIFLRLFWPVWQYLWFVRRIQTHTLQWSWTVVFFPFIVFFALIIIHNLEFVYRDIKAIIKGSS